jgi:hypothetical protein
MKSNKAARNNSLIKITIICALINSTMLREVLSKQKHSAWLVMMTLAVRDVWRLSWPAAAKAEKYSNAGVKNCA